VSELRSISATLTQACREAGAVEVEVLVEEVQRRGVRGGPQSVPGSRSPLRRSSELRCTVRARDERGAVGVVTATDPAPLALSELARSAVARARLAAPDPYGGAPDRLDIPDRGLGILDLRMDELEDSDRADVVRDNIEGAQGLADGVVPVRFTYVEEEIDRLIQTSAAVLATEHSCRFRLEGVVRDEQRGEELTEVVESRRFADVASMPLGVDLARKLATLRTRAELPPAPYALLLDPTAVARLLPALAPAFSAEAIAAGASFLAGRLGSRVASSKVHLIDDPGLTGALRSRAFDDRGIPPMALPLLREGLSGATYLGPELARARGQRPTGHRRADGSLWTGNLLLRAGTRTRNMLLPDLRRHVAIDDFLDLAGLDLQAGTMDVVVRALVMEGPEVVGCAGPRRLRCSVVDLLSAVVDACSDQERIRDVDACTLIVQGPTLE